MAEPTRSNRSSKGFSRLSNGSDPAMANTKDATIDIPLNTVPSKTGVRLRSDTYVSPDTRTRQPTYPAPQPFQNEKADFYTQHVAGRRHIAEPTGKKGNDSDEDKLTQMGVIYNKVLNFSVITRYFLFVLPLASLFAIPIIIGATAVPDAAMGGVRIVWIFSWVECVWLSLWVSKLAAKSLPYVFQFLCGIVSSGTRKYALVLQALEIYLSLSGWALASLATFIPIMTRNPTQRAQAANYAQYNNSTDPAQKSTALVFQNATGVKEWESVVQRILAAFLVASLILLAEKLLTQLISISYHRTQFNTKIKESKHKVHLLSLLYEASRSMFPAYGPAFAEEDYIINDSIELAMIDGRRGNGHHRPGSATPMRLIQNMGRVGDKLTSAFGNIAHEVTGKEVFNPDSAHSIVVEALEKNRSSEALAKRLWMSFVLEGKEALFLEDILDSLGVERRVEAEEAFAILDRDGNGDISLDEMILTVCEFGKDRHSIAKSLHDVDQAINVLDGLLATIVFIITIFIFVAFLNSSFTTTLATAGTALLSLSFVFATTCQEVLGSCIFLFVKHPYDVLDRVDVGDDQLIVKHISLLFTVFKHVNNHKQTQVPNIVLNSMWIQNITRSEAMREQLLIYVDFGTTLEDIQFLRNEMQAFVQDKDNARDFQPDIEVEITGIAEMNKMELKVEIRHKSNWSNETVRAARRSKFMCALVLALRKVPIYAPGGGGAALGSVDQPSYTVSIPETQAASNRDAFDKAKDAKRLFPTNKPRLRERSPTRGVASGNDTSKNNYSSNNDITTSPAVQYRLSRPSESIALNTLNSRHPAADTASAPTDLMEPTTSDSVAQSVSGTENPEDLDRKVSIEEVRGLLRRQSTRGKRKINESVGSVHIPPISETTENSQRPSLSVDFDPYSYSAPYRQQQQQQQSLPQDQYPAATPIDPSSSPLSLQRTHISQLQNQQRSPPPRQAPPIAPTSIPTSFSHQIVPKPYLVTTNLSQSNFPQPTPPTDNGRTPSPVPNPFQIHALRNQAYGVNVPQMSRPVLVNTNAFAQQQQQQQQQKQTEAAGIVRPPRGDSLPPA